MGADRQHSIALRRQQESRLSLQTLKVFVQRRIYHRGTVLDEMTVAEQVTPFCCQYDTRGTNDVRGASRSLSTR
jgi:hypothetical protein